MLRYRTIDTGHGGRVEWQTNELLEAVTEAAEDAAKQGAEVVANRMRQLLRSQTKERSGDLRRSITTEKSKYEDGGFHGYIIGPFEPNPPPRWEDSLAAQGVFLEYGHHGPGQGRTERGTKKYKATMKDIASRVARPRPWIRPALRRSRNDILKFFQENLESRGVVI